MIFNIQAIKDICSKISVAVDDSADALEFTANNETLTVCVSGGEYCVQCMTKMEGVSSFKATVKASTFLKLISMITTDTINLSVEDNALVIKGNGTYNIPIEYKGSTMLTLPRIEINNPTFEGEVQTATLQSLLKYNFKEMKKGVSTRPAHRLYYVNANEAITYNSGACVNTFDETLPFEDKAFLLNPKVVSLFRIIDSKSVDLKVGFDTREDGTVAPKISIDGGDIIISAYTFNDNNVLSSVPVNAINSRANKAYPYCAVINKENFVQALNRILIFATENTSSGKFVFSESGVEIVDITGRGFETVKVDMGMGFSDGETYVAVLNLNDLKTTLETCYDETFNIKFGDHQAVTISRTETNVINIVPEILINMQGR